jgi:hypothetical protein
MFVHFIVVLAILFASGLIEEVLFLLDVDYNAVQGLGFVFNISFAVAFGLLGNFFYLKKSEERMLEIINSTNDEEQKLEVLARKGGISYSPYYVLGGIVLLLFIIGMFA